MKRELSGGITSRKRFAGKSDFSAKQVSTTLLLLLLGLLTPQKGWAVHNLLFYNSAWYNYDKVVNNNTRTDGILEMSSTDYAQIDGAKVGNRLRWKNGSWSNYAMNMLAFKVNTADGATVNNYNGDNGWYLRYVDNNKRGLFTGDPNSQLAILDLHPGDIVTISGSTTDADWNNHESTHFRYKNSVHCVQGNGQDLYGHDLADLTFGQPIYITGDGDLIIQAKHFDTFITQITINRDVADYKVTTDKSGTNPITTFEFTKDGRLEDNDFAIPYMSVMFGNGNQLDPNTGEIINDFIRVNSLKSEIYDINHSEDLKKNNNDIPYSGNVYTFKPTGSGHINAYGAVVRAHNENGEYAAVRVFEYKEGSGYTWVDGNPYIQTIWGPSDNVTISFDVKAGYTYFICEDNRDNVTHGAFHMNKFTFENTFYLDKLAKIVDLSNVENDEVQLTKITGASTGRVKVKRCSGNIEPTSITGYIDQYGFLKLKINQNNQQTFSPDADNAGTAVLTVLCGTAGEATFVATFPYHANYGYDEATGRSRGHIWNFIDPRLSDSNIGNCWIENEDGTGYNKNDDLLTGVLSIGQWKNRNSQLYKEWAKREWSEGWTIKSSSGEITDPMYKNVYDMEGDNADMIWETEGLWFETLTNQSCIYNENNAMDGLGQPTQHLQTMTSDPDRYVGLVPAIPNQTVTEEAPSFTIPGLKDGDRVLIYMKSASKSGSDREAIFLNIEGALDAVGTPIVSTDLYGAGGTDYIHSRYEGCYHFIKDASETPMKFTMVRGAICKLMYIQIYTGKRIDTDHIERGGNSPLLFLNDEGIAQENAAGGYYNLHYRGKGETIKAQVLVQSGNLTNDGLEAQTGTFSTDKFWYFKDSRTLRPADYDKNYVQFKSTVGEYGVFRLRLMDMDFIHDNGNASGLSGQGYKYVCDFADRNFTVGYREKKSYPYTWDFTDMQTFSGTDIAAENTKYPETTNKYERKGWDISLWDEDGYMLIGNEYDANNDGDIFSQNKNGFGNQLYANDKIIPETQGLWFYMDDNNPVHNRCMQITSEGLHFVNQNLGDDNHNPWWNYKMVVPSVPSGAAVYLRMKRDPRIEETDKKYSDQDLAYVLFLNTRFHFGTSSETNPKTSLTEDTQDVYATTKNEGNYAFFKVPGTEDEYILVVKNNTGAEDHLTFTLNGWIVKKLSVSEDFKKVNKFGWATESRDHVIDQALTTELTGNTFETYVVTGADYASKTVTIEKVNTSKKVMKKATEGGNQAYIIRNMDMDDSMKDANGKDAPGLVKILDDGFHLFVPDMHDFIKNRQDGFTNQKSERDMGSSKMKALLGPQTLNKKGEGNIYNYVLTTTVNQVGMDVEKPLNDVGFYRVKNGSSSAGNQGYLPVDCTVPTGTTDGGGAKMSLVFVSFDDSSENVETAIEVPFEVVSGSNNAVYYNLNGQKMSGKPTKGGLYIMNGKKILVK